jgi:RHS repeat-associated protein
MLKPSLRTKSIGTKVTEEEYARLEDLAGAAGENRGGTNPQDTWSFGTYWTDSVTGLDYANNRYYFNSLGRFMTPDPYASNSGGAGDPSDPQSWNRYSYTRGDPVNRVDPAGMQDCAADFCVTGYGLGDSEFGGSPGVGGSGGIIEPWNDPAYPKWWSITVTAPSGIGSANYQSALLAARQAQGLESKLKDSANCDTLLGKLGMDWQDLQSAVAAESFKDGTESTDTMVSLFTFSSWANYQAALATYGSMTIQYYLAHKGINSAAVSSAGGTLVFLNYLQFGGGLPIDNVAVLMHEALHNFTGFTDNQIQGLLGLTVGASSQNITALLQKDCE